MTPETKKAVYWSLGILGGIGLIWGIVALVKKSSTPTPGTPGRTPAEKNRTLLHGSPLYSEIPVQAYINVGNAYKPYGSVHPSGELIGYYDANETNRNVGTAIYAQTRKEMNMTGDLIWFKTQRDKLYTK